MKIVSLDPASFRNMGWSVIDCKTTDDATTISDIRHGTFVMPDFASPWMSLWPLREFLDKFFDEEKPDYVIMEQTGGFRASFITSQIANSIGVILSCCGRIGVDVQFVYPTHVKKVITGKGKATKTIMKRCVRSWIELFYDKEIKFTSEHDCDACANIFCWLSDQNKIKREEVCPKTD